MPATATTTRNPEVLYPARRVEAARYDLDAVGRQLFAAIQSLRFEAMCREIDRLQKSTTLASLSAAEAVERVRKSAYMNDALTVLDSLSDELAGIEPELLAIAEALDAAEKARA